MITILILGLLFLLIFSYLDIKYRKIENFPVGLMFLIGILISIVRDQLLATIVAMAIFSLIAALLWYKSVIGGADAKILAFLPCFMMFKGVANMFVSLWVFIVILLVLSSLFFVILKISKYKRKRIQFVPIITLSYVLYGIWVLILV